MTGFYLRVVFVCVREPQVPAAELAEALGLHSLSATWSIQNASCSKCHCHNVGYYQPSILAASSMHTARISID